VREFLDAGFILEHEPDRLLVGWGPFAAGGARIPDRLGCYAPDFFLDDPTPWHHPAGWREMTRAELKAALGPAPAAPATAWCAPERDAYLALYRAVMRAIGEGTITKAVPVVMECGRADRTGAPLVHALLARALEVPPGSAVYGHWSAAAGMVGVTPEILFRADGRRVETAAIASTRPRDVAAELLTDPKELAEHQSVVDDIEEALRRFGEVKVGARDVLCLPELAHLRTALAVEPARPPGFTALVAALHPTAALGVAPRAAGPDLLRALDRNVGRRRFGAPIGVEWPDGRATCLVAIRGVQWEGADLMLGAGGGVIARSEPEREWDELALKRTVVKGMLGL
jgi:menaquinone-specific isochorismate synthase